MVSVADHVKSMRRDLEDDGTDVLWIEMTMGRKKVLVGNLYRPPDAPAVWMENLVMMLEAVVQEKMAAALMGGFNCNMLRPGLQGYEVGYGSI
jgi:hypothetical protein